MKKLVIIPAYNESSNILNTVRDIQKSAPDFDYIVFVSLMFDTFQIQMLCHASMTAL